MFPSSDPKTRSTQDAVHSKGIKTVSTESISRPPKAKKIKCDETTASQVKQHTIENKSKTKSDKYVTTTNKYIKSVGVFKQHTQTSLSFAVKQDKKEFKLPITQIESVDSTKETFSSKLKEDTQPTRADLLKAKSQAKMLQRKDLSTENGVESVGFYTMI